MGTRCLRARSCFEAFVTTHFVGTRRGHPPRVYPERLSAGLSKAFQTASKKFMRYFAPKFALLALLILPTLATSSAQADDIPSHVKKANAAAARKDWDGAIAELDAVIALDKNNAEAYAGKAVMLMQKGDLKGAIAALDPKNVDAYQVRSGLHQQLGETEQSKADYEKVLQLAPNERNKLVAAAQAAQDAKDWKKALSLWLLLAEALPNDPRGHYGSGLALFNNVSGIDYLMADPARKTVLDKELADATAQFQAALAADPKFVPAYLAIVQKPLGMRSQEQYKADLALLNRGIQLVPNSAELYIARAGLSEGFEQTDEVVKSHIDDYTHALQYNANSVEALGGLGWAYHLAHRDTEALTDFNRALALKPDDAKLLSNRAQVYEALQDWQRSAADYGRVYALDATNTSMAFSEYLVLMHLPDTKSALEVISGLIAKDSKNALYLRSRAGTYLARKDYPHALTDVDASLAIEPDNANAKTLRDQIVAAQKKK